jgi:rubrerythrin
MAYAAGQSLEKELQSKLEEEQTAADHYKKCIKNYGDNPKVKKVLTEIMQDELSHKDALQKLIDTVVETDAEDSKENGEELLGKAAAAGGAKNPKAVAKKVGGKY